MVDFQKVNISRLSDSIILQHIWNSIEDIQNVAGIPTKYEVIKRCQEVYKVDKNDINKNIFLTLKEGTICRDTKSDVLFLADICENRSQGDWYCFLCHGVRPDIKCSSCDTSFHESCNSSYADAFHCHTCQITARFQTSMSKLSSAAQTRLLTHVLQSFSKIRWESLRVVGYIHDKAKNKFLLYREINSADIDQKIKSGYYLVTNNIHKNRHDSALFDVLLLRHNCTVIYGTDHEFYKLTASYVRNLQSEIDGIYCDSCYLLEDSIKINPVSTSTSIRRQQLFCAVCYQRHPVLWGLLPPNVFWPFKVISQDQERYYGIKFCRSISSSSRLKLEAFIKDTCLAWNSYHLGMADRPSAELTFAVSLAQKYVMNLNGCPSQCSNVQRSVNIYQKRKKKSEKLMNDKTAIESTAVISKRKVGRPKKKGKPGRPRKIVNNINNDNNSNNTKNNSNKYIGINVDNLIHNETLKTHTDIMGYLSSTESSSGSIYMPNYVPKSKKPKKRKKKLSDKFISKEEKPKRLSKRLAKGSKKIQKNKSMFGSLIKSVYLSSTDDSDFSTNESFYADRNNYKTSKSSVCTKPAIGIDYINHEPIQSFSSSSDTSRPSSPLKIRLGLQFNNGVSDEDSESLAISSDGTIPQLGNIHLKFKSTTVYKSETEDSNNEDEMGTNHNSILINNCTKSGKGMNSKHDLFSRHRSQNITDSPNIASYLSSSKYSAYASSPVYHTLANGASDFQDSSKAIFKEKEQRLPLRQTTKDLVCLEGQSRSMNNLETGLYCSSSSPINFSPMSNICPNNLPQVSIDSTPSSNCMMSSDEFITSQAGVGTGGGNMKLRIKKPSTSSYRNDGGSPYQFGNHTDHLKFTESNEDRITFSHQKPKWALSGNILGAMEVETDDENDDY